MYYVKSDIKTYKISINSYTVSGCKWEIWHLKIIIFIWMWRRYSTFVNTNLKTVTKSIPRLGMHLGLQYMKYLVIQLCVKCGRSDDWLLWPDFLLQAMIQRLSYYFLHLAINYQHNSLNEYMTERKPFVWS